MPDSTRSSAPGTPELILAPRMRPDFDDMGDYFAYFKEALPLGHPKLDAMVEYARSVGAELRHELTAGTFRWPFRDMACRVYLEPVSTAECDEFRRRFAPDKDGRIDIL